VVVLTAVVDKLAAAQGWDRTWALLLANGLVFLCVLTGVQLYARSMRRRLEIGGRSPSAVAAP
jgi:hypothetical protein